MLLRPDQLAFAGLALPDRLFPFLDARRPALCCLCDYLIFYPRAGDASANDLNVVLCELKSGRTDGAVTQLRNGKLVADHILASLALHGRGRPTTVYFRGVVFSNTAPTRHGVRKVDKPLEFFPDERFPELARIHGEFQDSCRLGNQACFALESAGSRSGLRQTTRTGFQLRVLPVQRSGW
ncbi:MAG: hypothetical protein JNL82_08165, partial [Myxococcales bacterium]|nr:hypothetical protein [Myxococcales bacterium]